MTGRTTRRSRSKRRTDEGLAVAYVLAVIVGLVMVYSTSSLLAESRFGSHLHFFRNQMMWTLLSLVAIWILIRINLEKVAALSVPLLLLSLGLLCLVFLMPPRNGSHRWIILGPFTFQPSELFRFAAIAYLAFSLANPKRDITNLKQLLWPYLPVIGLGLGLVLLEPDLGTTAIVFVSCLAVLYLAGMRIKHLIAGLGPLIAATGTLVFVIGYKKERVLDYLAAISDPLAGSYQVRQAALSLGSGGLLGTGLGEGRQKAFFLPYPHTDFVFASIGEEIGLLGLLIMLGLLFYLIWRGFRIAAAQPDRFGYLLAGGMTVSLMIGIITNVAVVTALVPVTGLPLPFISYGGSSLLMSSAAVGVLLNLSKRRVAV